MADPRALQTNIAAVSFTPVRDGNARDGMLGYVTCVFADALRLDGIALRITATGRHALSFPARTDRQGRRHPFCRPIDDRARRAIEAAIFEALGIGAEEGQHDGR
ncbi:MAG: septation protein SpoVG family protein [Planctomycetes bacterium]|nr:septation protein SpoVG family protein [Planctomycetota bacterium]